ncbi:MAG: c-type cytochrome [Acidimicrobiia bacterium]
MKVLLRQLAWLVGLGVALIGVALLILQGRGVSARPEPSGLEKSVALFMRGWMTPSTYKGLKNPVSDTDVNFVAAREHFADHCASCHANDGSGNTEIGRHLYPKSPDMRLPRTQQLSDGELFSIIENGVMLTGMPGWSTGTPEGEKSSWQLVNFIRRLSKLTPEDLAIMERFNPGSRAQFEEERAIDDFLKGGDTPVDVSRRSADGAKADPHAGHKP